LTIVGSLIINHTIPYLHFSLNNKEISFQLAKLSTFIKVILIFTYFFLTSVHTSRFFQKINAKGVQKEVVLNAQRIVPKNAAADILWRLISKDSDGIGWLRQRSMTQITARVSVRWHSCRSMRILMLFSSAPQQTLAALLEKCHQ
jgi:hypothetical protein